MRVVFKLPFENGNKAARTGFFRWVGLSLHEYEDHGPKISAILFIVQIAI
jgi:hypothetical protein